MVFRRRRADPPIPSADDPMAGVDPALLPALYGAPVADALRARHQFGELVAGVGAGPLADRLADLGQRVDAGVLAVWGSARHAAELDRVVATLDPDRAAAALKQARRSGAPAEVEQPLAERFASVQRLLNARDEVRERLPLLEARLAAAVARTAELTLTSSLARTPGELDTLARELDTLTVELSALGQASAELG